MSATQRSATSGAESATYEPRTVRRAMLAGSLGTLIEYYDFSVYGYLAVVIAPQFFPSEEPHGSAPGDARGVRHRTGGAAGRRRLLRMARRPMGAPQGAGLLGAVHGSRQQCHRTAADLQPDRRHRRGAAPAVPIDAGHLHGGRVGRRLHLHLRVGPAPAQGLPRCRHAHRVQPRVHVRGCHGRM